MRKFRIDNKDGGFTLVELLASMALLALITLMVFVVFSQSTKVWRKSGARIDQHIAARIVLDQMAREIRGAVMVESFAGPGSGSTMGRMDFVVLHAGDPNNAFATGHTLGGWRTPSSGDTREQPCSDQIYFVAPVENSGKQDYCMIGYWVRDDKGETSGTYDSDTRSWTKIDGHTDDTLYRYFVTDNSSSPEWGNMDFSAGSGATGSDQFALNVKSLRIRCWSDDDSSHFTTTWEDVTGSGPLYEYESKVNWDTSDGVNPPYDDNRLPKAVKITIVVQDEKNIQKEREFSTVVYLDNAKR